MNDNQTLHKALITIKKLKQLLHEQKKTREPIAIIGLSCRFPQAQNKDEYWHILSKGINTITPLPAARWELLKNTKEAILRDKNFSYYGGYLENITDFDAYFFGLSPREVLLMDPQQRILLEVAEEALLDANLSAKTIAGSKTGIFVSLYASQFAHLQELNQSMDALFLPTGNATSIAANRLSYFYDLHGPSMVLDTACSSSLIALHLACLNLQARACHMAFVGAVHINLLPSIHSVLAKAKMLSPAGQCKTFDASADGYVPGEGAGMIILKPLSKAIADRNFIYAVIAGSAINQDGKTNGLTAPNGLQQEKLLKMAYQAAHIEPEKISYVECHGTGTFLGDPIEIQALGEMIGKNRSADQPCWIGSVKTNIGHLEPAAGMASVIKVALSLQNKQIPPHLNFSKPNPHIAFEKYHLNIPLTLMDWPCYGLYRTAGISGFGFGGSNAHIVLRELSDEEKLNANTQQLSTQTIAWDRKTYWTVAPLQTDFLTSHPMRGCYIDSPLSTQQFRFLLDTKMLPEVQDTFHVLHAGFYLEMLAFAAKEQHVVEFTVENMEFLSPLLVPHETQVAVQLILNKSNDGFNFQFFSQSNQNKKWIEHAKGELWLSVNHSIKIPSFQQSTEIKSADNFYARIEGMGMPAGDTIRWTKQYSKNNTSLLCEFREPRSIEQRELFSLNLHPGIIDACIQPIFLFLQNDIHKPYVAQKIKKIIYRGVQGLQMKSLTVLKNVFNQGESISADGYLFDENNQIILFFEDIKTIQLNNTMKIKEITELKTQCDYKKYSTSGEQKQAIINYLKEQFSLIFSMPKEDILIHTSLQQLGMDSLLALAIIRVIETGLDISFSMQEITQDISIEKIADRIVKPILSQLDSKNTTAKWIAFRKSISSPKKRLFCFPYGGAGASLYRNWQSQFPNDIEVCPIQLPGRETRLNEKPMHTLEFLIPQLLEMLQPELTVPFAFFGHSFGALIAFELTRALRQNNLPQPIHLFSSAFPDPRTPSKSLDNLLSELNAIDIELAHLSHADQIENLSDHQLQAIADIFYHQGVLDYRENSVMKDIMKMLLPIFVGDMSIVKNYQYREEAPLNLPITVFLGKKDTWISWEDHQGWSNHTQSQFELHPFESGHLFVKDKEISKEVIKKIVNSLN